MDDEQDQQRTSLRRVRSVTSLHERRRRPSNETPTVLSIMVSSYQVQWRLVEGRIAAFPHEARYHDEHGRTVLYMALSRRLDDYPPVVVVKDLIRAYPEAVWHGIDKERSPLNAACWRRASYDILRLLMSERPSVKKDRIALLSFWRSYCDLFRGESQLVEFLRESQDLEALRIIVRLFHLLSYCTSREYQLKPFSGLCTVAASTHDIDLLRFMIERFPNSLRERTSKGRLPLHEFVEAHGTKHNWRKREASLNELIDGFPEALRSVDLNGDLPLHVAIKCGWRNLDTFIKRYPASVAQVDGSERLFPFQLAACCEYGGDLVSIYNLLRCDPSVISCQLTLPSVVQTFNDGAKRPDAISDSLSGFDQPNSQLLELLETIGSLQNEQMWRSLHAMLTSQGQTPKWFSVHGASSVPMCPVGLLEVFNLRNNDIEAIDGYDWTPLHHAVSVGGTEEEIIGSRYRTEKIELPVIRRIRFLLKEIPDRIERRDSDGHLPLHIAAICGMPVEGLKLLVESWPAALTQRSATSRLFTALLAAESDNNSLDAVYYLLRADPNVINMAQ